MKSILQDEKECWLTRRLDCAHRTDWLEKHHVFHGNGNRALSEKYGLTVYLNHFMHNEPPEGVHFNEYNRRILQDYAQRTAMRNYGWTEQDFIRIFGRSYLDEIGLDIWPEEDEIA